MRPFIIAFIVISAVACQRAQQSDAGAPRAGTTTYTRGTPVTRTDTPRGRVDSTTQPPAAGEVTVTLDRGLYAPGATISARVTSQSRDTLGYNQCSNRAIERHQNGNWFPVQEPNRMCTMELRLLMPNESQTVRMDLPSDVTPGTYRVILTLSRQRTAPPGSPANWGTVRAMSSSFRVE